MSATPQNDNSDPPPVRPPSQMMRDHQPTGNQQRWMMRGLSQPGGKLPLFDDEGQKVSARTVASCLDHGWVEPWFINPIKPDWMICKLTDKGRALIDADVG